MPITQEDRVEFLVGVMPKQAQKEKFLAAFGKMLQGPEKGKALLELGKTHPWQMAGLATGTGFLGVRAATGGKKNRPIIKL